MHKPETLIIIPTYFEEETIGELLTKLKKLRESLTENQFDVLVVDDNSQDKTIEIVKSFELDWTNYIVRPKKDGLGNAYKHGFKWAKERGYEFVIEMDADGSHRVDDLPKLLTVDKNVDLVLGSRWISGGGIVNWPISRQILSKFGNFYARTLLRLPIKDSTGGFRRIKISSLFKLDFDLISPQGYGFQVAVSYLFFKNEFKIVEVPIIFIERERGQSKMTTAIAIEAFKYVTKTRLFGIK